MIAHINHISIQPNVAFVDPVTLGYLARLQQVNCTKNAIIAEIYCVCLMNYCNCVCKINGDGFFKNLFKRY